MIGEGFHAELGGRHAEVAALADCAARGNDPAGATMIVTLEPCAHHGRQPPCTDAIVAAGIARVVIGADDPTEKASGRGPGILRDEGIEVAFAEGADAAAARLLDQAFRKHARTGKPLVLHKAAVEPRRRDDHAGRRARFGSPGPRAGSGSTAGAPRRARSRSASARRSPTTRCSPRATSAPAASRCGWSSTARRGCRSTRAWRGASPRRRCSCSRAPTRRRTAWPRWPRQASRSWWPPRFPWRSRSSARRGVNSLLLEGGATLAGGVPGGWGDRRAAPVHRPGAAGRRPAALRGHGLLGRGRRAARRDPRALGRGHPGPRAAARVVRRCSRD